MAVTTTEAYFPHFTDGRVSGTDVWQKPAAGCGGCEMYELTSEAAERDLQKLKSDFQLAVKVGVQGSGYEKAIYSAHAMTEKYSNWFGGDDTLSVYILVSDEQEQSHIDNSFDAGQYDISSAGPLLDPNGAPYTIESWAKTFQARKSNPALTRFFPIVRLEEIPGEFGDGDTGDRYKKMAELTGGIRSDIDKPFDGILEGISNSIASLIDSFLLKSDREILVETLVVYVNGQVNTDWTYANKAVKFTNPPAEGSDIKVT